MQQRERKIDVNGLTIEEADRLSSQIGNKVRDICDEAAVKINTILKIYGMSAKLAIVFDEISKDVDANNLKEE